MKKLVKGAAPVKNAEIKKEKGEKKMKKFSVAGGVKNAWKNHKVELTVLTVLLLVILGLSIAVGYLLTHKQKEIIYRDIPVYINVNDDPVEVPVEVPTATEEDNNVRN